MPGSRRYDNPAASLFKPARWEEHRAGFCRLVGKSPDASQALPLVLGDLEGTLKRGDGPMRLNDEGGSW